MSLPLYDHNRRCVKCGAAGTNNQYCQPVKYDPWSFITRTCCNCGYSWGERPLDQATPEELIENEEANRKRVPIGGSVFTQECDSMQQENAKVPPDGVNG